MSAARITRLVGGGAGVEISTIGSGTLIGVGGGVVTDITGYVAGIYMRGIPFGFVPT